MNEILPIENTLKLLCQCWDDAERSLQENISVNNPDIDEENITIQFREQLLKKLNFRNQEMAFAYAFNQDLIAEFPHINSEFNVSQQISSGLIAELKYHKLPIPDPSEKETIISDGDILCPDRIPENVRTTIKMLRFISQKTI